MGAPVSVPCDREALLANLRATQERCNELLEEARTARRERDALKLAIAVLAEELRMSQELLASFLEFEIVETPSSQN